MLNNIVSCSRILLFSAVLASLTGCSRTQPADDLPPIVYMCPMLKDADVLLDDAGKCPKCGMELKPIRIATAYSCLNNTAFIQATPGKCRTDGTDLVPITVSMFWVCAESPDKHELDPGKCADGSDRILKFEPRLHGDHNPRHGGQLFMADDGWHHLEGAHPAPGLFRVFFYDDWTRPLAPEGFTARVIVKDGDGKELATVPVQDPAAPNAMEARIPTVSLPMSASLLVRFKAGEPEKIFDFTFRDYSKEPAGSTGISSVPEPATPAPVAAASAAPATPVPDEPVPSPVEDQPVPAPVEDQPPPAAMNAVLTPTFQREPIPAAAHEILAELNARSQELATKAEQGAPLGEYWFPALRAKDLGLALINDHLGEIPVRQRGVAENAAGRLLRAAYAIDDYGDLGDREKLEAAYGAFVLAVNDLRSAYASIR